MPEDDREPLENNNPSCGGEPVSLGVGGGGSPGPGAIAGVRPLPAWARPLRIALLVLIDLLASVAAWGAAYWLYGWGVLRQGIHIYLDAAPLLGLFVLAYAQAGLYPGFGIGPVELLRRLTLRTSFVFLLLAAVTYWLKVPHQHSRVTVVLAWGTALVALPLARHIAVRVLARLRWWREPAVLVGRRAAAARLVPILNDTLAVGWRPVALLDLEPGGEDPPPASVCVGSLADAPRLAARGLRVAVVQADGSATVGGILDELRRHFRQVILLPGADDVPVSGAEVRDLGGVLGIEFTSQLLRRRNRFLKRAVDVTGGALGCLLGAPVMAVAVAAVKLSSRGPAFFVQEREGLHGRPIRVWKIRTMVVDAEQRLARHLAADAEARREWETRFKLRRDPRIIPVVGHLLRRLSIDELPQLASVLVGTMSLVGPRPFPSYHLEEFSPAFRELRAQVRPGLTGLWQVVVRSDSDLAGQQALDTYYIRNWSLWLDLYLMARTVLAVVAGKGAR